MNLLRAYSNTLLIVAWICFDELLCAPIKPWIPDSSELHELIGIPHFVKTSYAKHGKQNNLWVNGVLMDCGFNGMFGGMGSCGYYSDIVNKNQLVRVTYFRMKTTLGFSARMLNTIEQNKQVLVSAETTYKKRILFFETDEETQEGFRYVYLIVMAFVWFMEWSKRKSGRINKGDQ
jgi:hypothetical protein